MSERLFRDFMLFWTTLDPPGTVALFAGLTAALSIQERRRVALRASFYAAIILIIAVVIGQIVLDAMGIRVLSLKLAGGIILFSFLCRCYSARPILAVLLLTKTVTWPFFPLAVPSIAGPGGIMAVILRTDNDVYTVPQQAETAVVLLLVLLINYILLLLSDFILRIIGQAGASILVRVMGMILAALSVEIVMNALGIGSWSVPVR